MSSWTRGEFWKLSWGAAMPGPAHRRDASKMLRLDLHMVGDFLRMACRGLRLRGRYRLHFGAFPYGVAGVDHHLLPLFETRENFQAVAEVAAQLDAREMHAAIGRHHGHLRTVAAHHQGVARNQ